MRSLICENLLDLQSYRVTWCALITKTAERTQQLLLMREIYTKPKSVYTWFGEKQGSEGSRAVDLLRDLSGLHEQAWNAMVAVVAKGKATEVLDNQAAHNLFLEEFAMHIQEIDLYSLSVRCGEEAWQGMSKIGRRLL